MAATTSSIDLITILGELNFTEQINEIYQFATQPKLGNPEIEQGRMTMIQKANAAGQDSAKQQSIIKETLALITSQGELGDREVEGAFNLIAKLIIDHFDEQETMSLLENLFKAINSEDPNSSDKAIVRYRVLSNIFNALPIQSPNRCFTFKALLDSASSNDDLDVISDALVSLPNWLAEWNVSAEEKSDLLVAISHILESAGEQKQAYEFMLLHLRFLSSSTESGQGVKAASTKEAAERTIAAALNLSSVFDLDQIANVEAVKALQSESIGKVLNIFLNGKTRDWLEWSKTNAQEISRLNLSSSQLDRKIRLIDLANLCSQSESRSVSYKDISTTLDVPLEEVEIWVIDVIRAGLVSGKLSEIDQTLRVYKSVHRQFGSEQWKKLEQRLLLWDQSIDRILQTLRDAKQQQQLQNGGAPKEIGIPGADSATATAKQAQQQSQIVV